MALALHGSTTNAQTPTAARDSALTCAQDLDAIKQRLEMNYGGYTVEVKGDKLRSYQDTVAALRKTAERTQGSDCYFVLDKFIHWFNDPHLFVYQNTTVDTAETTRRARLVQTVSLNEIEARALFIKRAKSLDPIEGIWYDGPLRVAIVPDTGKSKGRFIAVVIASDTSTWREGTVRARFTRRKDGGYDADISERNYGLRHANGEIYKRIMLRLSPGIWGKAFPIAAADSGLIDPVDVHRPTIVERRGTVIVSIPSHDPGLKKKLDSLIAVHQKELTSTKRLVIDLRGNEGGGSFMSDGLIPYIASEHLRPSRLRGRDAMMMSSPDQIAYARRAFGSDTSRFVRTLLERMQAHPGELVPLNDTTLPPEPERLPPVIPGPRRVGVLIDRGTVSASEVLVLDALRSERTTVFGQATAGALDYQSTSIARFSPRESRWYLGYPTITRNTKLPLDGMRGVGIAPNVTLNLARLSDPIAEVDRQLAHRGSAPH
ncbi:MAG: S41 family peptidase [Gemmatimonadaceae bacterium]